MNTNIGIVSYGTDIPTRRIKVEEIAKAWNKDGAKIRAGLMIEEKAVPGIDEDTATLAVNATNILMDKLGFTPNIGAIYSGSESHPYAVKPTSGIVGEALGIGIDYTSADLEFACKAGTAAMQIVSGLVESKMIEYGLAIGADTAQSRPDDALEYTAAAAGASFLFGAKKEEIIAKLLYTTSVTSDTPDFWRREKQTYPTHAGRFTGEPAYFKHIVANTKKILKLSDMEITDFTHVVFHMPNGKFPRKVAKMFGVKNKQLKTGFVVTLLGNSYSASSLIGFAKVLDESNPGDKILLCSYGSGSGSDAFIFEVTENIKHLKDLKSVKSVQDQMDNKEYIDYNTYLKHLNKIKF